MKNSSKTNILKILSVITFILVFSGITKILTSSTDLENRETPEFSIPELDTINDIFIEDMQPYTEHLKLTPEEEYVINKLSKQNLIVGCMDDRFGCFTVDDENYGSTKMIFDIINETLDLNLTLEATPGTPLDSIAKIDSNEHSMLLDFSRNEERLENYGFSEHLFSFNTYFYTSPDNDITFQDLFNQTDQQVTEKKVIGVAEGSSYFSQEFLDNNNLVTVGFEDDQDAVDDLNSNNPTISGYVRALSDDFIRANFDAESINRYRDKLITGIMYEKDNEDFDILMNVLGRLFNDEMIQFLTFEKEKIVKLKYNLGHFFSDEEFDFIEDYSNKPLPITSLKDDNQIITQERDEYSIYQTDGLGYEITTNILEMAGFDYSLKTFDTTPEVISSILDGDHIAAIGIDSSQSRLSQGLTFSEPFLKSNFAIYGDYSNTQTLTTNNLRFANLGYIDGYTYNEKILDVQYPNNDFDSSKTMSELLEKFDNGEIDFFISDESSYNYFYHKHEMYNLEKKLTFHETCTTFSCSYRPSIALLGGNSESELLKSIINKGQNIISFSTIEQKYDYSVDMNDVIDRDVLEYRTTLYLFSILGASVIVFVIIFALYEKVHHSNKLLIYDDLTGLYSRRKLIDDFELIRGKYQTFNYIDLNKLKFINDNFGHKEGDNYLKAFSRLVKDLGDDAEGYRIGGDEFVVLLKDSYLPYQLNKLIETDEEYADSKLPLKLSVGSLILEEHKNESIEKILIYSDRAMYVSKNSKTSHITYVDKEIIEDAKLSNFIEQKSNIKGEKLKINSRFQPIMDISTGIIAGVEVLARCEIDGEVVLPDYFLKFLRQNNTIDTMDLEMFENGLKLLTNLRDEKLVDNTFFVASNFSPISITSIPLEKFIEISDRYDISRHLMHLEVTEELLASDEAIQKISDLKDAGFSISIDDFTAGHSSFNYFFKMSPDTIKFDKQLIASSSSKQNVNFKEAFFSLVSTVSSSNSHIVIEGIETEDQLEFIKGTNIGYAQGYYFSKPISPRILRQFILDNKTKKDIS